MNSNNDHLLTLLAATFAVKSKSFVLLVFHFKCTPISPITTIPFHWYPDMGGGFTVRLVVISQ